MGLFNMIGGIPQTMDEMEEARRKNMPQGKTPPKDPSMWERFNKPQNWAAMSNAFNTLRFQPDQNLAAFNQSVIDRSQTTKSANKSVDYLRAAGVPDAEIQAAIDNPELMKGLLSAVISSQYQKPKDSYATVSGAELSAMGMPGFDPAKMYSMNMSTNKISSIGGEGPTINLSNEDEDAYSKGLGQGRAQEVNDLADKAGKSRELLSTVSVLEALSPAVGESAIPGPLRRLVPPGISSPIDAYNATLNGVAAALRVPGSGAQSDKDVDLLLARGGSIAASPEARAISHAALRAKASIDMQVSNLAARHRSDPQGYPYSQFEADRQKIMSQPILTDDQRNAITALGSSSANQRLLGVDLQNMSTQQLRDLESNLKSGGQ